MYWSVHIVQSLQYQGQQGGETAGFSVNTLCNTAGVLENATLPDTPTSEGFECQ